VGRSSLSVATWIGPLQGKILSPMTCDLVCGWKDNPDLIVLPVLNTNITVHVMYLSLNLTSYFLY